MDIYFSGTDELIALKSVVVLFASNNDRKGLVDGLKSSFKEFHECKMNREGLFAYARYTPDVLLADFGHLDTEGAAMLEGIKEINPSVILVLIVDKDDTKDLVTAIEMNAFAYVLNPATVDKVLSAVAGCASHIIHQQELEYQKRLTEILLNGLPHPAMLLERGSRKVLLANQKAKDLDFKEGSPCVGPFYPEKLELSAAMTDGDGSLIYKPLLLKEVQGYDRYWNITLAPATVNAVLLFAVDITEIIKLQMLREDVERIVRHDLKTPLGGIIGMADELVDEGGLSGDNLYCAQLIQKNGDKMLKMINKSMDLIKMEEGTFKPSLKPFNLLEQLAAIRTDLEGLARAKSIKMVMRFNGRDMDDSMEFIYGGDPIHMEELFANLVKNAVEAAPENTEVNIDVVVSDDVLVVVHNMGTVPVDIRDKFFERYATSGKRGGTGLGTYSAMLIAKAHGGGITFTSSEKEGTRLFVKLPRELSAE